MKTSDPGVVVSLTQQIVVSLTRFRRNKGINCSIYAREYFLALRKIHKKLLICFFVPPMSFPAINWLKIVIPGEAMMNTGLVWVQKGLCAWDPHPTTTPWLWKRRWSKKAKFFRSFLVLVSWRTQNCQQFFPVGQFSFFSKFILFTDEYSKIYLAPRHKFPRETTVAKLAGCFGCSINAHARISFILYQYQCCMYLMEEKTLLAFKYICQLTH